MTLMIICCIFIVLINAIAMPKEFIISPEVDATFLYGSVDKPSTEGVLYLNTMKKASDQQIIDAYNDLGNIWKVAELFDMCGQSIHERLKKLNVSLNNQTLSAKEKSRIIEIYKSGIQRGDGKLKELSNEIGRTIPFISRFAGSQGLTSYNRNLTQNIKNKISKNTHDFIAKKGHPKGYLGKNHSEESLLKIGKASREMWNKKNTEERNEIIKKRIRSLSEYNKKARIVRSNVSWKGGERVINSISYTFRSSWEYVYAKYLEHLRINNRINDWSYEPDLFFFKKRYNEKIAYKPDFKVIINGRTIYVEVKGWMDYGSIGRITGFKTEYSHIPLYLVRKYQINKIIRSQSDAESS